MTKIIILENDGGEMGNQLWNYISVFAYALERGYSCENFSFFEYAQYFNVTPKSKIVSWLFFLPFRGHNKRRNSLRVRLYRFVYKLLIILPVTIFLKNRIVYSRDGVDGVYYLPPTIESTSKLSEQEHLKKTLFFSQVSGGVFRNSKGIEKHRVLIEQYFHPAPWVAKNIQTFVSPLRARYKTLVGVHIRQRDYAVFKDGKFTVSPERFCEVLNEYLVFSQKKTEEVVFIIASDGYVDKKLFEVFNIEISNGSAGEDMFTLSLCDVVIGSDSTFGYFSAYYGNIPHIVIKREPIDWDYYRGKESYFINKYLTVMLA